MPRKLTTKPEMTPPKTSPLPRRPTPAYQRSKAEKIVDSARKGGRDLEKTVRRIPKDLSEGGRKLVQGGRAVKNAVVEGFRRVKRSTR